MVGKVVVCDSQDGGWCEESRKERARLVNGCGVWGGVAPCWDWLDGFPSGRLGEARLEGEVE